MEQISIHKKNKNELSQTWNFLLQTKIIVVFWEYQEMQSGEKYSKNDSDTS